MRYKPNHKEESRVRILAGAGKGFRRHGLSGIGVDGLAKEAGVTSGAFYGHFASKSDAFSAAVSAGLAELREGIEGFQRDHGDHWLEAFIDFYLGFKRTCDLEDACGLQALTPEVMRAETAVRSRYEIELRDIVKLVARGLPQATAAQRQGQAWALLAMLSGGVSMSRAMADPGASDAVAKSLKKAALAVARSTV